MVVFWPNFDCGSMPLIVVLLFLRNYYLYPGQCHLIWMAVGFCVVGYGFWLLDTFQCHEQVALFRSYGLWLLCLGYTLLCALVVVPGIHFAMGFGCCARDSRCYKLWLLCTGFTFLWTFGCCEKDLHRYGCYAWAMRFTFNYLTVMDAKIQGYY